MSEETARAFARRSRPRPLLVYELLPAPEPDHAGRRDDRVDDFEDNIDEEDRS